MYTNTMITLYVQLLPWVPAKSAAKGHALESCCNTHHAYEYGSDLSASKLRCCVGDVVDLRVANPLRIEGPPMRAWMAVYVCESTYEFAVEQRSQWRESHIRKRRSTRVRAWSCSLLQATVAAQTLFQVLWERLQPPQSAEIAWAATPSRTPLWKLLTWYTLLCYFLTWPFPALCGHTGGVIVVWVLRWEGVR